MWEVFSGYGPAEIWKDEEIKNEALITQWNNLKLVEWEPSSLTVAQLALDRCCRIEHFNCKTEMAKRISTHLGIYNATVLDGKVLCGTARTMDELDRFCEVAWEGKPDWTVLVTPSEVWHNFEGKPWDQCFWIDAVEMGSGMAGSWNILVSDPCKLDRVLKDWKLKRGKTMQDLYTDMQLDCALEVGGSYRSYPQEHSIGKKVIFRAADGTERLSAYSQVPLMTLDGCRKPRDLWPLLSNGDEVTLAQRIAMCGGAREWIENFKGSSFMRPAAVDALWRSTPKELWMAVLNDISGTMEEGEEREGEKSKPSHVTGSMFADKITNKDGGIRDPNDHFQAKLDYARTTAKVDLLMGKLSTGARKSYNSAWKHWCLFRRIQGKDCWLDLTAKQWDEDLLDWIIHEWHIMHLPAGSIRSKLSGIRYMHMISGYGDLSKAGGRAGLMLSAIGQREHSKSKLPLPSEVLQWIYENLGVAQSTPTVKKVWNALIVGFCFLMRGSEVANLRQKDVSFGQDGHGRYVTVFIASSKTDQSEVGVFRSLYASDSLLCPVRNLEKWMKEINSDDESAIPLFGPSAMEKLRGILKWAAHSNHLPVDRFSLHSMRIGGATCLFLQGIPLDDIRKYGRWKTTSVNIYLYFDDVVFRTLGKHFVPGQGVLNQLQMLEEKGVTARTSSKYVHLQQPADCAESSMFVEPSYMCGGKRGVSSGSSMSMPEYTPTQAEAVDPFVQDAEAMGKMEKKEEKSELIGEKCENVSPEMEAKEEKQEKVEVKSERFLSDTEKEEEKVEKEMKEDWEKREEEKKKIRREHESYWDDEEDSHSRTTEIDSEEEIRKRERRRENDLASVDSDAEEVLSSTGGSSGGKTEASGVPGSIWGNLSFISSNTCRGRLTEMLSAEKPESRLLSPVQSDDESVISVSRVPVSGGSPLFDSQIFSSDDESISHGPVTRTCDDAMSVPKDDRPVRKVFNTVSPQAWKKRSLEPPEVERRWKKRKRWKRSQEDSDEEGRKPDRKSKGG